MEGTWQPLKQRGSHGLVEVQLNEDQMAENMSEGLQQTSQVIKMEGRSCSGHHNQLKQYENCSRIHSFYHVCAVFNSLLNVCMLISS